MYMYIFKGILQNTIIQGHYLNSLELIALSPFLSLSLCQIEKSYEITPYFMQRLGGVHLRWRYILS